MTRISTRFTRIALCVAALACSAGTLAAPGGTYVIDGGGYSIDMTVDGDTLVIREPNKTSTYTRQSDGTYHFTNPNNGITYGIRIIDDQTVEAFKPGNSSSPTRLTRMGAPGGATNADVADAERYEALAARYSELAQSDSDNIQTHTACAAVAMKRTMSSRTEADAYAAEMASMLRQILVDPSANPCPDVFTSW